MIRVIPAFDLATQLARYCFARLLGETTGMAVAPCRVQGFQCGGVKGREVIWPEWLVDGEFPRIAHLNLPWVHWREPKQMTYAIAVAGTFRRSELFAPHRERIREWLGLPVSPVSLPAERPVVGVLARPARNAVGAFPNPAEVAGWTVGITTAQVSVLLPHGADAAAYRDHGFTAHCASDWMRLAHARRAPQILAAEGALGWWAAFLSHADRVAMVRNRRDEIR
jgi:hypothetical protein